MNIFKLNRILYLFTTLVVVGLLATSCERSEISTQGETAFFSEIDKAEYEASIANSDVKVEDLTGTSAKSHPCADAYTGGHACPRHVIEARHRYGCWAAYYAANPTESNRISRDTAYCDYLLAYNYCYGENYSCPY